ncbi:MFS transporter, partial [Vibrio parahaemolyticus]
LLRAQLGLAAGFALCGLADNLAMFVFGLIVQGTFGGTMAASNSYLSSQIKEAKTLSKSLNKTQLSARLALIVAPIGLGWSLSET